MIIRKGNKITSHVCVNSTFRGVWGVLSSFSTKGVTSCWLSAVISLFALIVWFSFLLVTGNRLSISEVLEGFSLVFTEFSLARPAINS